MVKNMFKETAKAGKNPLWLVLLWFIFIYVFYIVWGIGEILLEIKIHFAIKHLILFVITSILGWSIIFKFLVEYDFVARKHEFTATKRLSKKSQLVCVIKYENIVAIYNENEKQQLKNFKFYKKLNFVRAYQGGKKIHIVYNFDSKIYLTTLKLSRQMINVITDHVYEKKEENI